MNLDLYVAVGVCRNLPVVVKRERLYGEAEFELMVLLYPLHPTQDRPKYLIRVPPNARHLSTPSQTMGAWCASRVWPVPSLRVVYAALKCTLVVVYKARSSNSSRTLPCLPH